MAPAPGAAPALGDDVEIAGSGVRELDGEGGVLVSGPDDSYECEILLWAGRLVEVPCEHVRKLAGPPSFVVEVAGTPDPRQGPGLCPGDVVEIYGLQSEAGRAMNGCLATVCQYLAEVGRFEVSNSPGKFVKLKPENLRRLELRPGDHVEVNGLTSESGKEMNGKKGTITRAIEEKGRFEVRLGPYWMVSLKAANLQRLDSLSLGTEAFHALMRDLVDAYAACPELHSDTASKPLAELRAPTAVIEKLGREKYLAALRGAQAPVFERYGYPGGNKGADLLKAEIRRAALSGDAEVARLSRELDYRLGILPPGEGRGDGGDDAQATRLRLFARSKAMAWRELGQAMAAKGAAALREEADDASGSDTEVRERLAAAASIRIYESLWAQVLVRQPTLLGAAPADWRHTWARDACTADVARQLVSRGWAVLPGALEPGLAAAAGAELAEMFHGKGRLRESSAPLNRGAKSTWLQIASDEEQAHVRLCFPSLFEAAKRLCGIPEALVSHDGSGLLAKLRTDSTVKVSAHEPGVKHGLHLDSFGGESNFRMVTCLLYVNAPDFSEQDGGALRIYEELAPADLPRDAEAPHRGPEDPHVDVSPLTGTLVIFQSRRVCHEVLPATRNRYLMTLWVPALP